MNFSDFKNSASLLSKEQMKNVKGGMCQILVHGRAYYEEASNIQNAIDSGLVTHWCCDSCGSATWAMQ